MSYATVELCSGGGGFEAVPRPRHPVDLLAARKELERGGVAVVDARVMLMFDLGVPVTLSRDGRILLRTRDPAAARRSFEELCRRLQLPCAGPPSKG